MGDRETGMAQANNNTSESGGTIRSALPLLLLTTSVFLLNFLSRVVLAPLLPEVRVELGIGHAEAGGFFLVMAAGVSLGLLSNGAFASRLTHRGTIALSALVLGASLVAASLAENLNLFRIFWAMAGYGAGLYLPSGIATVTSLVRRPDWGKALAVHEMAPNGSFVLAPLVAELMLAVASWRTAIFVLGAAQIVLSMVFLRGSGRAGNFAGAKPSWETARKILRMRSFWAMTGLFMLGVIGSFGPYSMIPLYLVDLGWTRTEANQLLTVSRTLAFCVPFGAGWLVDRMGAPKTIAAYLVLNGAATVFLGLASGSWLTPAVLLQPMLAVTFFPAAFTMLSSLYDPSERSVAVSFMVPFGMFAGLGAGPVLLGVMGDLGRFGLGFAMVGALLFCGLLLLPGLRASRAGSTALP